MLPTEIDTELNETFSGSWHFLWQSRYFTIVDSHKLSQTQFASRPDRESMAAQHVACCGAGAFSVGSVMKDFPMSRQDEDTRSEAQIIRRCADADVTMSIFETSGFRLLQSSGRCGHEASVGSDNLWGAKVSRK